MTHVIFDTCIRDGACVEVCPVECIIPGMPEEDWPWYYIDPDVCIDCGACVPECPTEAILPEEDMGDHQKFATYTFDTIGLMSDEVSTLMIEMGELIEKDGEDALKLNTTDLNAKFFTDGPGYDALDAV